MAKPPVGPRIAAGSQVAPLHALVLPKVHLYALAQLILGEITAENNAREGWAGAAGWELLG